MTDIPSDILATATTISDDVSFGGYEKNALAIGRAILAERRRCALIARQWETSSFQDEHYAANSIADKIMAGEA